MRFIARLSVVLLLPAVAGCGSAGPTSGSDRAGARTSNDAPFRYAQCIRSHGVPSFPDPVVTSSPGQTSVRQMVPASAGLSPKFEAAQKACRGILPTPGARSDHQGPGAAILLAFAKCLRSHGISTFPDPGPQGQITRQMLATAGVNLRTPVFLDAARACIGVTHGAITPADIRAAISGPH